MRSTLSESRDPNLQSIERVLPGVNQRFDVITHALSTMDGKAERRHRELMQKTMKDSTDLRRDIAATLGEAAIKLGGGRDGDEGCKGGKRMKGGVMTATIGTTGAAGSDGHGEDDSMRLYGIAFQTRTPCNVTEVYNEFKGLGEYSGVPIDGGIAAVEAKTNRRWRSNFSPADQKHFSRVIQLVRAVDGEVGNGADLATTLSDFESIFVDCKKSFSGLIAELQNLGYVPRKARRLRESP